MAAKNKPWGSWINVLLIAAAVAVWAYDYHQSVARERSPAQKSSPPAGGKSRIGGYEVYRHCTLTEASNNDGDSFMVKLPDGRKAEFRLYFVDTPESAFKSYASGETNHARIRQQAAEMGGITPEQAVETGKKAKKFTHDLLASHPFDLYTRWDSPFNVSAPPRGTSRPSA